MVLEARGADGHLGHRRPLDAVELGVGNERECEKRHESRGKHLEEDAQSLDAVEVGREEETRYRRTTQESLKAFIGSAMEPP